MIARSHDSCLDTLSNLRPIALQGSNESAFEGLASSFLESCISPEAAREASSLPSQIGVLGLKFQVDVLVFAFRGRALGLRFWRSGGIPRPAGL